jgi:hypothetical protein
MPCAGFFSIESTRILAKVPLIERRPPCLEQSEMPSRKSGLRVMIADTPFSVPLKILINAQADTDVVAEASNGAEAVQTTGDKPVWPWWS